MSERWCQYFAWNIVELSVGSVVEVDVGNRVVGSVEVSGVVGKVVFPGDSEVGKVVFPGNSEVGISEVSVGMDEVISPGIKGVVDGAPVEMLSGVLGR